MPALWYPYAIKDHADHSTYMNKVRYIVWHDTEGHPEGDLETLRHGGTGSVSIHFLVMPDGRVYQFLPLDQGANHAGFSDTGLAESIGNPNHYAIGIELSHYKASDPYPKAQLDAAWKLLMWLDERFGKLPQTAHKEINPTRKSDPNGPFPLEAFKARVYGAMAPEKPKFSGRQKFFGAIVREEFLPELEAIAAKHSLAHDAAPLPSVEQMNTALTDKDKLSAAINAVALAAQNITGRVPVNK